MGASGAIVMSFFGALFASMTLLFQLHWSGPARVLPFIGFAAIATAALLVMRLPGGGLARPAGAGRVMLWSSIGEGVGLFVVANLLTNTGHAALLLPAMALVVGLHFLPIAYGVPFPPLYTLAVTMIVAGVIGLLIVQPAGGAFAGFVAAGALAVASLAAVRRERAAKPR
jgi:hypothetical protein